jgi:L-fuculose-phosphate aldolase
MSEGVESFGGAMFLAEREAVAAMMSKIYALRLTTASGGNISMRLPGERCAITPGGGDKAATTAEQVAVVALTGESLIPGVSPSSEFRMHLAIYRRCPRVGAIVHAHPPTASAFTAVETPILADLTAEGYAILRRIAVVPYALTGTEALGELAAEAARKANCLLLENHGATTLGATLHEAFNRMEVLEAAAWQTWLTRSLDKPRRLTAEQIRELEALYGPDLAGD